MTVGRYAVGFAALVVVCASMALAAVSLRSRLLPEWTGAVARLAESVLGLALVIGILEALGAVGLFAPVPIIAACVLAAGGARAWSGGVAGRSTGAQDPTRAARPPAEPGRPSPSAAAVAVALIAGTLVIVEWAVPTLVSYDVGIRSFDSLWYHLPWAASFAQTGWVTSLRFTDVEYLTAFYPATAELVHGLGIVLLGRDTLSPALNLGWLALTLLAAWCIGSPRGLGPATMTGAALALATPMLRISQGGTAANDIVGVFFLLAAVALVVNADLGSDAAHPARRAALVLAAIAAGLAVSVKLSLLAPVLALTAGTILIARRGRRGPTAAAWVPALVLAAGYWYARNLIAVGNPLPWLGLGILPIPAAPLQQHTGFAVVHYATDTKIWSHFFGPGLAAGLGPWWVAVLAVTVLGPVLCLLGRSRRTTQMLGFVALASLAAYLVTPETAAGPAGDPAGFAFNLRYAAPGLTLALAVTPLASWLDGARARAATLGVLALLLVVMLAEDRQLEQRLPRRGDRRRRRGAGGGRRGSRPRPPPAGPRHDHRWRRRAPRRGRDRRLCRGASLSPRSLHLRAGRIVALDALGVGQGRPRCARRARGHVRRLFLLSVVRYRRLQSGPVHRRSWSSRLVHADPHLPGVAHGRERGALPVRGDHAGEGSLAPARPAVLARGRLDGVGSRRPAGLPPGGLRAADLGLRADRPAGTGRLSGDLRSEARGTFHPRAEGPLRVRLAANSRPKCEAGTAGKQAAGGRP